MKTTNDVQGRQIQPEPELRFLIGSGVRIACGGGGGGDEEQNLIIVITARRTIKFPQKVSHATEDQDEPWRGLI